MANVAAMPSGLMAPGGSSEAAVRAPATAGPAAPAVQHGMTGWAFFLLCAWQFVGSLAIFTTAFLVAYAALAVPIALLMYFDKRKLPRKCPLVTKLSGPPGFELGRSARLFLGVEPAPIGRWGARSIELTLPAWEVVRATPDLIEAPELRRALHGGNKLSVDVTGRRLGRESLGYGKWLALSPLGLWTAKGPAPLSGEDLNVAPSTARMPEQKFTETIRHQRRLFLGARQLMRGAARDQFHSVRPYVYPDPLRSIDHKKSARYGKLMTRTYDAYHQHHLVILCDLGRSLTGTVGQSAKLAFYLSAAANLVRHALAARDQVSFCAFRERVCVTVSRARSYDAFMPLWRGHQDLAAKEIESDYNLIAPTLRQLAPQRALVVLLADVVRPSVQRSLLESLGAVCRQHRVITLGLIDQRFDLGERITGRFGPGGHQTKLAPRDAAEWIYSYALDAEFQAFRERMARLPSGVFVAPEMHWLDMVQRVYELMRASLGAR